MSRGRLIVISAPSGAGKTTITRLLREHHPGWGFSVSSTTRPQRPGEVDGQDYAFISEEAFDRLVAEEKLAEWEWVHDHRYGTPVATLEATLEGGHTLILDVDVKGGLRIKGRYAADTVAIFIEPPDEAALLERLKGRGTEEGAIIQRRLERFPEEMAHRDKYDHVVVNDNLDVAVAAIEKILEENR